MKYVNLKGAAYVNGVLRHPHEGALHLTDGEAKRLLDDDLADDVTEDFADAENAEAPPMHVTTASGKPGFAPVKKETGK